MTLDEAFVKALVEDYEHAPLTTQDRVMLALLGASNPRQALLGTAVVAAGVPVYLVLIRPRRGAATHAHLEEA